MKQVDFIVHRPIWAAIYEPFKDDPNMSIPARKMPYGIACDAVGKNDHLPVTFGGYENPRTGLPVPPRFRLQSVYAPTLKVTGWREFKDILDHLTVCNIPRDRVFRFVEKMTIEGAYIEKPEYEGTLIVLKRVIFDATDIDTEGLFE